MQLLAARLCSVPLLRAYLPSVRDGTGWHSHKALQSAHTTQDTQHTQSYTPGTVTHMPMEVLVEGKISKAADVYSFGECNVA